jgi:sugar O-acyltransferase (sialic acid O-acetyltransferase NeuD family)
MPTDPLLLVFGAGGHGKVVADAGLAQVAAVNGRPPPWQGVVASDHDQAKCRGELLPGVRLVPPDEARRLLQDGEALLHLAIGRNAHRAAQAAQFGGVGYACVVHPAASVSPNAQLASGCFVAAQAVVAVHAVLGQSVIVNHGAVVDHDCEIGEFSHLAPGAVLGGGVTTGSQVLVGAGARLLPGVVVGHGVTIGAGAVLTRDAAQGTWVGVPARRVA